MTAAEILAAAEAKRAERKECETVKRFKSRSQKLIDDPDGVEIEDPDGDLVRYSDYRKLERSRRYIPLDELSPWIAVEDRLPASGTTCLVALEISGERRRLLATFNGEHWASVVAWKTQWITHWIELPGQPEPTA